MKKRLLSTVLVFSMLLSVFPMNVIAVEDKTAENAERIATNGLPEVEFAEGLPYAGFTTQQGKLPEKGLYSLAVSRTGDTSIGSDLIVSTVDISAVYGKDYVIEDSNFVTELVKTDGTILEQAADEENRKNAQKELEEIRDQIIGSTAEVDENADTAQPVVDADGDGELSLAELKALQSGKNVRDLTESDFHSLKDKFLNQMNIDVADYVAISSQTRISFLPNETTKTLTFRVLEDNESEGEEIFNFLLSAEDTDTAIIEANTSVSFIIEDDEPIEHSVVTLTADTFTAKNGILTVSAKRETAEYSYTTVGVKVTGRDTDLLENTEYAIAFQPYQTESSVEIPVTQNGKEHTFKVELYDFKGCDKGSIMTAQVKIPAVSKTVKTNNEESPDSYLDDFKKSETNGKLTAGRTSINIAGMDCEIVYDDPNHSNYGSIMLGNSKIGIYVALDSMNMFSAANRSGSGDHWIEIRNDGNPYLYFEYYSSWAWNTGEVNTHWYYDRPNRYRMLMSDVYTDSSYDSAEVGVGVSSFDVNDRQLTYDNRHMGNHHDRGQYFMVPMFNYQNDNYTPRPWAQRGRIIFYTKRAESGLQRPGSKFYGEIMLYREYRVKVEQPDKLSYRSGELNSNGTPKMVSLSPAAVSAVTPETRYYGEPIQFDEFPAKGNKTIYGELEGYYITPLDGKTFFYSTNKSSLELNDDLIKRIDENTTKLQKGAKLSSGDYLAYTTIIVKPKYKYKNVSVNLLTPKGLPDGTKYSYLDKDLENMNKNGIITNTNTFHIGDTMNLEMQAIGVSESFVGYNQYQYRNPGDTAYDKNVPNTDNYVEGTIPGWVLECPKCEVRGLFGRQNYISIEMDELAERYFTIRNLVPQNEITQSYMKGQNILAISNTNGGSASKTIPVVGRAYTIELDPTEDNEQMWRPVITFASTGQRVNGFAGDFIARDNYQDNIVRVSAERYSPDWYEYFSVDGMAYYSAYSLRANSEAVKRSPVMQAIVTGGSSDLEVYTSGNKELKYIATRFNSTTDNNGKFSLALRAVEGDTVSIVIDNNDMQQVKYVRMMRPSKKVLREHPEIYTRTGVFDELVADTEKQQNVNRRIETQCAIVNASDIDMPIRTFYSPYVNSVSFAYKRNGANPTANQIPIYDSDEMTLSVNVVTNGADIKKVNIKKIARNGSVMDFEGLYDASSSSSYDKKYDVMVSGQDMAALDRFYVQVTAVPKGGNREITYTALDTGLEMYVPQEQKPTQFLDYEMPTPYDGLPILGDMAGDLDSGKLSWRTVYADENHKSTSPYAEIVTLSVSKKDIEEKSEKLKSLGGPEDKKSWDTMLKDKESDVYSYLNQSTQDNIYEAYKQKKNDNSITKEQAKEYFNSHPEEKKKYQDEFKKNAKKDALSELGETEIDVSLNVLVQLEYNYNPVKRTHYYSGGQYIINAAVSVEKTFYWTVFGVPVYLNIAGEASIQFDGRYVTDEEETAAQEMGYYENLTEKVKSEYPYIELGLGITLQPGVGICGVLGVRGILKFAFVGRMNTDPEDFGGKGGTMGTFTGGVGVDLLVFSFEYEIGSIGWKTGVFKDENLQSGMPSEESFSIRAFDNGKEYKNENLRSTLFPDAKTTLINGAMEYIRPQLIDLGDGRTMLLFLRNMSDENRDESNASTLVYAVRSADGTWNRDDNNNIASVIVENDNMADSTFAAMKSGDKVYIAWTNANITENFENDVENAKSVLQSSDIHMAVFDIATETMSNPITVTDDEFVNSDVMLAQEENNIALYYFKKDISTSQEITDLVGLSNNYNTWARKVYDPVKKQFIEVAAGKTNPYEELIVIEHPLINDAMVTDLSAADYTYKDKNYRFYSYTVDRDGNLETVDDRELWVRVTNLTDSRDYYPMPVDAGKDSVLSPKLIKIEDDVYLTWLSNDCTYNAISANRIFKGLDDVRGTGIYAENSGLDMVHALTAEQIAKSGWYKLPYDSLENASREEQGALYDLSCSSLENSRKEFGELNTNNEYEGSTLNDHQLVAGGDGNLYLFWTEQPNINIEYDTGRELYGAALYRGEGEYSGWSDAVQLTNYGKVIDELTVSVGSDKGAILVGNLYSQEIGYDGKVVYDDHELAEIDFIPGNSLEFALGDIVLSDYYPVEGEKVTASFGIENNGLLPAEKYHLTVNGEKQTITDQAIYPGQSSEHNAEFVAGKDGALTVSAEVRELGEVQELAVKDLQSNKTEVSTKTGAVLEFGTPAIYTNEDVIQYFNKDGVEFDLTDKSEENINKIIGQVLDISSVSDERFKAVVADYVRNLIIYQDHSFYYACVPVTNVGNLPGNNLDIYAYIPEGTTDEITEDKLVGFKNVSLIPVKQVDGDGNAVTETVYAVVSLANYINAATDFDHLGVLHLKFKFELDGEELEETAVAERQFLDNRTLNIENSYDYTIASGESLQIETTAYPWNELKELSYYVNSQDDEQDCISVTSDGLVTGINEGSALLYITDLSSPTRPTAICSFSVTSPEPHEVTFIDKLSGNAHMLMIEDGAFISEPTPPVKDGWTFNGWYTDAEYTTLFDFNTPITENITLYAGWTQQEIEYHTVTFYDEFAGRPNKISVEHGTVISDPPMPTYDGWTFNGWYIDEEYTTLFDLNTPITANTKLYAKWTEGQSELINVSTVSAEEIVLGNTLTVNALATGGTGDYTYAVYYKKTSDKKWTTKQNFTDNAQVTIKPAHATTYDICAKVMDSSGTIVKKYFTLNVTAKLENTSEISAAAIYLGDTVTLNASATGGTGTYTYGVYYKKTSDAKWITKQNFTDNAQITIEPTAAATYDICVKVKDESGKIVKKYFKATVTEKLENISEISAAAIYLGDTLTVNAAATGGTGTYTYSVYYKKTSDTKWTTAQKFTDNAQLDIKFAEAANYDVCVKVKDSSGTIVKKYFALSVTAKLENISEISAKEIELGNTLTVNAAAAGGTGTYTYGVYYKKTSDTKWATAQKFADNAQLDIEFAEAANYDVCVKVKDSSGTIAKKYFTVSVNAADEKPKNTPDFSINITRSGNIITIEISANGDSDSSEYAIYYKKNFDTNWIRKQDYSTNSTVSVTPQTSEKYDIYVKAKDSLNNISEKYFKFIA